MEVMQFIHGCKNCIAFILIRAFVLLAKNIKITFILIADLSVAKFRLPLNIIRNHNDIFLSLLAFPFLIFATVLPYLLICI